MPGFTYLDDAGQPNLTLGMVERNLSDRKFCLACRLNMAMYLFTYRSSFRGTPIPLDFAEKLLGDNAGKTFIHVRSAEFSCIAHGWRFNRPITLTGHETRRHILPEHKALFEEW